MRTLILALSFISATTGCIVYDNDGNSSSDRPGSRPDVIEDTSGEETLPDVELSFSPPQAEQGEIFIGSLSSEDTEMDLTTVTSVNLFGDADILAVEARASEVLVTVAVDADAETSESDILVEFADGSAAWLEAAFVISPEGSGSGADDYTGDTDPNQGEEDDPCP